MASRKRARSSTKPEQKLVVYEFTSNKRAKTDDKDVKTEQKPDAKAVPVLDPWAGFPAGATGGLLQELWKQDDVDEKTFGGWERYQPLIESSVLPCDFDKISQENALKNLFNLLGVALKLPTQGSKDTGKTAIERFTADIIDETEKVALQHQLIVWMAAGWRLNVLSQLLRNSPINAVSDATQCAGEAAHLAVLMSSWKKLTPCKRALAHAFWRAWTNGMLNIGNLLARVAKTRHYDRVQVMHSAALRNKNEPLTGFAVDVDAESKIHGFLDPCACMPCLIASLAKARHRYKQKTEELKAQSTVMFVRVRALLGVGMAGEACVRWEGIAKREVTWDTKEAIKKHRTEMTKLVSERNALPNYTAVTIAHGGGVVRDGAVALFEGEMA